jgi:hypothetical protein
MEGKTIFGHKCILNFFNQLLSTNWKGIWFLTIKRPKFSKKTFCSTSFFLKGSLAKINKMELEEIFGFFLEGCFSSSFKGQFIYSSEKFKTLE